jgi:hypothetical protein
MGIGLIDEAQALTTRIRNAPRANFLMTTLLPNIRHYSESGEIAAIVVPARSPILSVEMSRETTATAVRTIAIDKAHSAGGFQVRHKGPVGQRPRRL